MSKTWLPISVLALSTSIGACGGLPHAATPNQCQASQMRPVHNAKLNANVVRIEADSSTGSGFVLTGGSDQRLVVTNHHVIDGAENVAVQFGNESSGAKVVAEVVAVDRKNDLALLRVASSVVPTRGLELAQVPVSVGQELAVVGYPYVAGTEIELTYENGSVSATQRQLEGKTYIQTNANINPGNSGGPVLDGCGVVVGIATARHNDTERVGLLVPAARVRELIARHVAPMPPGDVAVRAVMSELFQAVTYRRSEEASYLFSRTYLKTTVLPRVVEQANKADERIASMVKELIEQGVDFQALSEEERTAIIMKRFSKEELVAVSIREQVKAGELNDLSGLRQFHTIVVDDDFGDIQSHHIDRIVTNDDAAQCDLEIRTSQGVERYRAALSREYGEWAIDAIERVR